MSLASGSNTSLVNLEGGDLLDQGIPSTLLAHADEAFRAALFFLRCRSPVLVLLRRPHIHVIPFANGVLPTFVDRRPHFGESLRMRSETLSRYLVIQI
jgi:hypothetical protein